MNKINMAVLACMALCTALNATKSVQHDEYQAAEHWATGYYQAAGTPDVYFYNDEYRWFCHVQNATQLNTYYAADQVRVIGNIWDVLNLGQSLNECPWWDGFYNTSDSPDAVYRLYPGNVCLVSTPEMLAAYGATNSVITAEAGSDFTAHRTNIGQCFWPY